MASTLLYKALPFSHIIPDEDVDISQVHPPLSDCPLYPNDGGVQAFNVPGGDILIYIFFYILLLRVVEGLMLPNT